MSSLTLALNRQSRQLIHNIYIKGQSDTANDPCQIFKDEITYADVGAIAVRIDVYNKPFNMFLFYPACNDSGNIGSVAIFGLSLQHYKHTIEKTMQLFGLPVESVDWEEGREVFLDVTIKDYLL